MASAQPISSFAGALITPQRRERALLSMSESHNGHRKKHIRPKILTLASHVYPACHHMHPMGIFQARLLACAGRDSSSMRSTVVVKDESKRGANAGEILLLFLCSFLGSLIDSHSNCVMPSFPFLSISRLKSTYRDFISDHDIMIQSS